MAFELRGLSVLAYANGFTLWHYKSGAAKVSELHAQDYFNAAGDILAAGDMIMVSANDGVGILCVGKHGANMVTAAIAWTPQRGENASFL